MHREAVLSTNMYDKRDNAIDNNDDGVLLLLLNDELLRRQSYISFSAGVIYRSG